MDSLRRSTIGGRKHFHTCRLAPPQAETEVSYTDFQRVAQRSPCDELHFLAIGQAHLQQAMNDRIVAGDPDDPNPLPHADLIKRSHSQCRLGRNTSLARGRDGADQDLCGDIATNCQASGI